MIFLLYFVIFRYFQVCIPQRIPPGFGLDWFIAQKLKNSKKLKNFKSKKFQKS
jgi:hypothetical protein